MKNAVFSGSMYKIAHLRTFFLQSTKLVYGVYFEKKMGKTKKGKLMSKCQIFAQDVLQKKNFYLLVIKH